MEELNLGLLIYFYSIWDNILNLLNFTAGLLAICSAVMIVILFHFIQEKDTENTIFKKMKIILKYCIGFIIVLSLLKTLLPPKEYMPLIMFSDDVASGVVESLESGKLQKINEIFELKIEETLKNLKGEI